MALPFIVSYWLWVSRKTSYTIILTLNVRGRDIQVRRGSFFWQLWATPCITRLLILQAGSPPPASPQVLSPTVVFDPLSPASLISVFWPIGTHSHSYPVRCRCNGAVPLIQPIYMDAIDHLKHWGICLSNKHPLAFVKTGLAVCARQPPWTFFHRNSWTEGIASLLTIGPKEVALLLRQRGFCRRFKQILL